MTSNIFKDSMFGSLKGATCMSEFLQLKKFSLNFSSWSFVIHVNLLH